MKKDNKKYNQTFTINRMTVGIALFVLFVAFGTCRITKSSLKKGYELSFKKATYMIEDVMNYAALDPMTATATNEEIYEIILNSFSTKFQSKNCPDASISACKTGAYKTMNGKTSITNEFYTQGERLAVAGMLVMINKQKNDTDPIFITVDTNGGSSEPNKLGYDVFVYQISDKKVFAMGSNKSAYPTSENPDLCSTKNISNNKKLGVTCANKALTETKFFQNLK